MVAEADERECPSCKKIVKRGAMKCRFCGRLFDQALIQQQEREASWVTAIESARVKANQSIWMSLLGVVVCGILLAPAGIRSAREALALIDGYPEYPTSVRTRARIGLVLGWSVVGLWVIGMVVQVAAR
jgi:hypothetical protein